MSLTGSLLSLSSLTAEDIAEALFNASGGNKHLLTSETAVNNPDGIWGKAVQLLYSECNNDFSDRMLLYNIWRDRRKLVELHFNVLAGRKTGSQRKVLTPPRPENEGYMGCFCGEKYIKIPKSKLLQDRIECFKCKRWCHVKCAGVQPEEVEDYECKLCFANAKLPSVFDETLDSTTAAANERSSSPVELEKDEIAQNPPSCLEIADESDISIVNNRSFVVAPNNNKPKAGHEESTTIQQDFLESTYGGIMFQYKNWNDEGEPDEHTPFPDDDADWEDANSSMDDEAIDEETLEGEIREKGEYVSEQRENLEFSPKNVLHSFADGVNSDEPGGLDDKAGKTVETPPQAPPTTENLVIDDVSEPNVCKLPDLNVSDYDSSDEEIADESNTEDELPSDSGSSSDENPTDEETVTPDKQQQPKEPVAQKPLTSTPKIGINFAKLDFAKARKPNLATPEKEVKKPAENTDEQPAPAATRNDKENEETVQSSENEDAEGKPEVDPEVQVKPGTSGTHMSHFKSTPRAYAEFFYGGFSKINKVCSLAFKGIKFGNPGVGGSIFIKSYADCNNLACGARWTFHVKHRPKKDDDEVFVQCSTKNKLHHVRSITSNRVVTGLRRQRIANQLKSKTAFAVHTDLHRDLDKEEVEMCRGVATLKAVQRLKEDTESADDLAKDVIVDLVKTAACQREEWDDKKVPGYLQQVHALPGKIIMYSYLQMKTLNYMTKFKDINLMLDATGGLVRTFPEPFEQKKMLLYTVLAQTEKGKVSVPITEMVSNDNTMTSVYTWLFTFFHAYSKRFNLDFKNLHILKFEVDFSKTLISSLIRLFEGKKLAEYMNMFWEYFTGDEPTRQEPLNFLVIHVCRFHILKAIRTKMLEFYARKPSAQKAVIVEFLMGWSYILIQCRSLSSYHRRVRDIAILLLCRYRTNDVTETIANLRTKTNLDNVPWSTFEMADTTHKTPFWYRSAFGQYAFTIFDFVIEEDKVLGDLNLPRNEFYSPQFANYLLTAMLPYSPIISYMCFAAKHITPTATTNNEIESYFGLLKTNLYKDRKNQKASRFVRRQFQVTKGICNKTLLTYAESQKGKSPNPARKRKPIPKKGKNLDSSHKKQADKHTKINASPSHNLNDARKSPPTSQTSSKPEQSHCTPTRRTTNGEVIVDDKKHVSSRAPAAKGKTNILKGFFKDWQAKHTPKEKFKGKNHDKRSPESQKEMFKKPAKRRQHLSQSEDFKNQVPLIPWGGVFKESVKLINTCNFDGPLQCLLAGYMLIPAAREYIKKMCSDPIFEPVLRTLNLFSEHKFDDAKTVWIEEVLETDPRDVNGDFLNTEYENAFKYMGKLFPIKKYYKCTNVNCGGHDFALIHPEVSVEGFERISVADVIQKSPKLFEHYMNQSTKHTSVCQCGAIRMCKMMFFESFPFLFYPLMHVDSVREKDIIRKQVINNVQYKVFGYTVFENSEHPEGHFFAKFLVGTNKIVYDGLGRAKTERNPSNLCITSVWLVREDAWNE